MSILPYELRVRDWFKKFMELDKLIDTLLAEKQHPADCTHPSSGHPVASPPVAHASGKRDQLAAIALAGKSRLYLGRVLTPEQINAMPDDEIGKLYSRYQMRQGATLAHSLGKGVLQLYGLVSLWRPKVDQSSLVTDLEANPFVDHSLGVASCKAYDAFGMALAPLSIALITLQHCAAIEPECPPIEKTE